MSDSQIDAILRALGSNGVHARASHDGDVRSPRANAKTPASGSTEAALIQLTPVPDRLLDLNVAWISSLEEAWLSRSDLKGAKSFKRKPVDLASEASKHRAVSQLANIFSKLTAEKLGKKWFQHFEAWLFARRAGVKKGEDIVLPVTTNSSAAHKDLKRKLIASGVSKPLADSICSELDRVPAQLADKVRRPLSGSSRVKVSPFAGQQGAIPKLKLTCLGVTVEINKSHYDKLRLLYARKAGSVAHDPTAFTHAAMALLLRSPQDTGTATDTLGTCVQAAVHASVLDTLRAHFGTCLECFASPLNCRWPRFCSLFADTDAAFGALGSFFQFRPTQGSFEANPPFDHDCVARMAAHMFALLLQTEEALMFVVVIPTWEEADCWQSLHNSDLCQHHLQLRAGEHGYCEGAQHNRANQFRVSNTDSSIFFLQNSAAAAKWPVTEEKLGAIQVAFRPQKEQSVSLMPPGTAAAGVDHLFAGDFSEDRSFKNKEDDAVAKPLQAIDTRATGQRLSKAIHVDGAGKSGRKHSRHDAACEHSVFSADAIETDERAPQGAASNVVDSDSVAGPRKKRKKMKTVASHTGKFCDTDTMRSLVAAAAQAAESGIHETGVHEESKFSQTPRKEKSKIQGKGGRRSISRLTVERRKLQYDSGSERDDKCSGSLVAATRSYSHMSCVKVVTNHSAQYKGKVEGKCHKHAKRKM